MSSPVITIYQENHVGEAADLMLKKELKRLPVIDKNGRMVGILSRLDIFKTITAESPDWNRISSMNVEISDIRYVRDIMQREVHTVMKTTPVNEIIKFIDSSSIQHVAVVDESGHLAGMISDKDLIGVSAEHQAGIWDYLMARIPVQELSRKHQDLIKKTKMKTAENVMKTDLVTVMEDTRIDEAIKLMVDHVIKLLPVVDNRKIFKGMISRDSVLLAGVKK